MKDLKLENDRVFHLVQAENERQLAKWGVQDRHPFEWLAYTTEEVGELAQAISGFVYNNEPPQNVVNEAIQTATLCLKIAEMFNDACHEIPAELGKKTMEGEDAT